MGNKVDNKKRLNETNENRIDEIINITEKHTRTERHLENNPDLVTAEEAKHIGAIQKEREERVERLKNIVAYDEHEE